MTETKDALFGMRAALMLLGQGVALPERPQSRILVERLRATHKRLWRPHFMAA